MSFDWQTEEDNDWDEQSWQEKPETAVSPQTPWRTILIILILLSVAGVIIYQQVNDRLDETTLAVESDIFASHNLLSRSAANLDGDLGKAVLSGRDKGWSQVQTNLIGNGLFYENPTFGLALTDATTAYEPLFREDDRFMDLQLDPDLSGGELTYTRDYVAFTGEGLQTVTLQQTAVYRRGETRWLLAPPLADFWGTWDNEQVDNITYIFPQREEALMEELTTDLSALVAEACATLPELDCSLSMQVRFDTDPASLLDAADLTELYTANLRLNLPAPTLVGLPINDDGYQALLYAYGSKMVSALISEQVGYRCCARAPMFQALMIYQLSELGLAEWPVTQETQRKLANDGVRTDLIFPYWSASDFAKTNDETSYQLFGFVDFLLHHQVPQLTALDLLAQMNDSRVFQSWLVSLSDDMSDSFGAVDVISRDWWFYAMTQAEATGVSQQPISLPAQDLQVGCIDEITAEGLPQTILYRYDLGSETWNEEFAYPGSTSRRRRCSRPRRHRRWSGRADALPCSGGTSA